MCTTTQMEGENNYNDKTSPRLVIRETRPFDPPPVVSQNVLVVAGISIFLLALIWPPLILVVTYVLSKLIPYSFRKNDDPTWRRKNFREFVQRPDVPDSWKNLPTDIAYEERFWVNTRGMCLLTYTMVPRDAEVKAVICFCHGYSDQSSYMKRVEYQRFVRNGIAVVAIEYEGHGRSDGSLALIPDWQNLIDDTSGFFQEVSTRFPNKKLFLMGESMGGAVAYCTYQRNPALFHGVVFVCPMCKVHPDMLPPQWVIDLLTYLLGPKGTTSFLGYLPIAPARGDLRELSYHLKSKRNVVNKCPTCFCRHPRLVTARELLDVTSYISNSLQEFDAPFLVQHGLSDKVTDPMLSQALYDDSRSRDKMIKLYEGMWHTLTSGEPDEDIDLVFRDAISWVLARI